MGLNLLNKIKLGAVVHTIRNTNDEKIAEFVRDYAEREFKAEANRFMEVVADKFVSVGVTIRRRTR